jgi:hypothetical protein
LELRGEPLSAAAAMKHLQPLTRLTFLTLDNQISFVDDEDDEDDDVDDFNQYFSFAFKGVLKIGQVWLLIFVYKVLRCSSAAYVG